ncbi:uncharacterized protein TNCV_1032771 [Trichonephila clavipes]|nr:uncharacterized protein TNCV_1032771 [Trichonephila clavipes]
MKCLLQDLWKEEIQWDDPLPTHIEKEWKKWSPLNCVTLSRPELLGALVTARLASKVKKIVNLKRSCLQYHWTDSKIVLFWIKGNKTRWKQFVTNRVNEITSLTDPHSWYHCTEKENPEDFLSRGLIAHCLVPNSRWWTEGEEIVRVGGRLENASVKYLHKHPAILPKAKYFVTENIDWKFIPPKFPHFGGLWEAGVKSVKHHLKRAIGNLHFTFEEFETIMIQVEGILNSLPLTPVSSDADKFDVLNPGHLLIGRPITSIPKLNLIDNLGGRTGKVLRPSSVALKSKNQEINRLQLAVKLP